MKDQELYHQTAQLLFDSGRISQKQMEDFSRFCVVDPLSADGSLRKFFRVTLKDEPLCVGVLPHSSSVEDRAESHAAEMIGRHLLSKKVPLPEILGTDQQSGLILFEDCGDIRLHSLLERAHRSIEQSREEILCWYKKALKALVRMQVKGAEGFDTRWCHDTPIYDRKLMISRESHYFLEAFWYDFLDGERCDDIGGEFAVIAQEAEKGLENQFLHRDFQCRNLMIKANSIKIIDFQGGRYGPPGYDLASLLIDPYARLDAEVQEKLQQFYLKELSRYIEFDENVFLRQYSYLRLQRNLQIIGAFAFLYGKRGKSFFKSYISPAVENLHILLHEEYFSTCQALRKLVGQSRELLRHRL